MIWKKPWMTVSRDAYIARTLDLVNWHTVPETTIARYPEIELNTQLLDKIGLVLLSTEPFMFREKHVAELKAQPLMRDKPVILIDGEMTSWYGSRAIEGLDYLADLRRRLELATHSSPPH